MASRQKLVLKLKILLDILMTAVVLCLLNSNLTGLKLHEILGIGVFLLFLIHKVFNLKWIKSITRNLFNKALKTKIKVQYAMDVALFLLATLNVITGILISTYVLTDIHAENLDLASFLHRLFAYLLLALLIVHIGLHWTFITNTAKIKVGSAAEKIICCIATAILVVVLMSSHTIRQLFVSRRDEDSHYQTETQTQQDDDSQDRPFEPDIPTLEQYLSKLFCTACGRRCLLTNPACGRGREQQENAVQEYNQTYQTNETYSYDDSFSDDRFFDDRFSDDSFSHYPNKPRK